jgi:hypothetical protein
MKPSLFIIAISTCLFASCASFDTGAQADYNGDGFISDAEYKQYGKQHGVVRTGIDTERARRDNAVDTVWDARSIVDGIRGF